MSQIVIHWHGFSQILLAKRFETISLIKRHSRHKCIHCHETAPCTIVFDESMFYKVKNICSNMSVLSIHIHTETTNFHCGVITAMFAMGETAANAPPFRK